MLAFALVPASGHAATACAVSGQDPVDAAACELAGLLEADFVFPDKGAAYARMLRRAVGEGRYAGLDRAAAAAAMTRDLQAVAPDGHLKVGVTGPERAAKGLASLRAPGTSAEVPVFEDAAWLAPGIGYLRLNEFAYDPVVERQVAQFMADHAGDRALIFDLRTNHGGGSSEMDLILPWLYAEPTRLLALETRRDVENRLGSPFDGVASFRLLPDAGNAADAAMVRREHWVTPLADARLRDGRVIVLVGSATHSAAEHFAFALKRTHRATLIGAPTSGADHFGGRMPIADGLYAWVPTGRTYDPDTGEDWEGHGVAPDIAIAPGEALVRALVELGLGEDAARAIDAAHRPRLPMERPRRP